jgi:putative ABC transport system permease protein
LTAACRSWDDATVIRLFTQVSLREHRAHWGRALLVIAGIATGVALMVAIDLINTSVLLSFDRTFAALAGPADLEVTLGIGEVGFAEDTIDVVGRDPAVALAVPLVRGTIALADDPTETLQLFGAELNAEEDLARYGVRLASGRRDALAALTDGHAILVTEAFAARRGLSVGSAIALATPRGVDTYVIRGTLTSEGIARVLGGQLVVMDLAAAQTLLVKEGRIDQLDLVRRPGTDAAATRARIAAALPATLTVGTPDRRATRYADILAGLQATFDGMSMLCVLAGLFIVYNATATGVAHRASIIGTLRLVGGNARQLRALLLIEATVLGAAGAISGVVVGVVLARVLIALVGNVMGTMTQMRFFVPDLALDVRRQLGVGALGIVVALCAAWLPARQATTLEPLAVACGTLGRTHLSTRTLVLFFIGLVVLSAATIGAGEYWRLTPLAAGGSTACASAGIVAGLVVVSALGGVLPRFLPRLFGICGRVAAANVVRAPVRSGVTVGAIALVSGIALTIADITASYLQTAAEYVTEMHDGDLTVSAVATEGGWLETPLAPGIAAEIGRIAGVQRVETVRIVPGETFRGARIGLLALAPDALTRIGPALWRGGDRMRGREALAAGRGVTVSTIFSDRFGVRVGDRLDLDTPKGALTTPVVGITSDLSSNAGTVMLSRTLYEEWWGDPSISRVNVYLEPGVAVEDARRRIAAQLGDRYRLKILALRENLAYHDDKIRRAFAFADTLQLLVAIVTVAGIFDLLLSGIIERRRELAVWRLNGAAEVAVRSTIVIESLTLGALASAVGLGTGVVLSWTWVHVLIPRLIGYDLTYAFATLSTVVTIVLVLLMTALAGWAAASRATRASVLEGLRAE